MTHPTDLLAEFVAGTAGPHEAERIRTHLAGCVVCRAEVAGWQQLSSGVRAAAAAVAAPPPGLFTEVRRRLTTGSVTGSATGSAIVAPRYGVPIAVRPARRALRLLVHQVRLVPWPVWAVSAVALLAGTVVAASSPAGTAERILAAVVPLVAALAVAGACGSGTDPADELTRSTITSPRVVLLARLTLVLGATTAAALAGTAVVAGSHDDVSGLVRAWLAPLVPLSALSFGLAVLWRPAVGVGAALALWCVRAVSAGQVLNGRVLNDAVLNEAVSRLVDPLWTLDPTVVAASIAVIAVTVFLAPRRAMR